MTYLIQSGDFCRMCRGRGRLTDGNGFCQCWECKGTGVQSVTLGDPFDEGEQPKEVKE